MKPAGRLSSRIGLPQNGAAWAVVAVVSYMLIMAATVPTFVADAPDMAHSAVLGALHRECMLLEPGHLLWRPAGASMLELSGSVRPGLPSATVVATSVRQLGLLAWIAGIAAVVCAVIWLRRFHLSGWSVAYGLAFLICSKAFINYSQVGMSYMPGLAFLLGGITLLSGSTGSASWRTTGRGLLAGALLATSVLLWGPFVLALPAAVAMPLILTGLRRQAVFQSGFAILGGSLVALAAGIVVWSALGLRSFPEFLAWASSADHGISTGGFARAVLGLARSFVETGDYGRLVKRFLLGDQFDPVDARELIGTPLVLILLFYAVMFTCLVLAYRRAEGKRILVFAAVMGLPIAGFAVLWQGGDLERFLPLTPAVLLVTATAFEAAGRVARASLIGWLAIVCVVNAASLSAPAVAAQTLQPRQALEAARLPGRERLLILTHWLDERTQLVRNYPAMKPPGIQVHDLLTPGSVTAPEWRSTVSRRVKRAWDEGDEVLVSARLLAERPRREWHWVEGDDDRVSWNDLYSFFRRFSYGATFGQGDDRFLLLESIPANAALLGPMEGESPRPSVDRKCSLPRIIPG